ncbi:hypothetical protein [Phorcysia thermohydrogeniphila]|uniref:TnsE C-terminal domain-containing protein n=1 Tax=Phorcysia thermohydrogeniphila TaxID=936138 RepID=A0A4V2PD57_9BACT|nr:hypothetical protein [Phorcysia thermohydrogeniphila]TCK03836.1 hypothetical protein CLV27_1149 [Phorcysia thermohydrogeniphila]
MPSLEEIILNDDRIWNNTPYFIPFVIDLQELGDTLSGLHFRVLFLNEKKDYVFTVLIPPEFLRYYSIFSYVVVDRKKEKVEITKIGEERDVWFSLESNSSLTRVGDIPSLSNFIKQYVPNNSLHGELDRQRVLVINSIDGTYYIPASVIGSAFYFPSTKFTHNLFKGTLSSEVLDFSSTATPPYVHVKHGYSNADPFFLYLYLSNREAKKAYDSVSSLYFGKKKQRREQGKPLRYVFRATLPVSGDWEAGFRVIPISESEFLVAEILWVNERMLLGTDTLEVKRYTREGKKESKTLGFYRSSNAVSSKSTKRYDVNQAYSSKEAPEKISFNPLSPKADKSVIIVKTGVKVPNNGMVKAIPLALSTSEVKDLSKVRGKEDGSAKPVNLERKERGRVGKDERTFGLDIVKKLMRRVEIALGVKIEYREFTPKKIKPRRKKDYQQLYYPDGRKKKVGVFFIPLPQGRCATVIFTDQGDVSEFISLPIIIGNRCLEFPDEVENFFKAFMEINHKGFRRFCEKRGFKVFYKKPIQGVSRKDWENWVRRMIRIVSN